MADQKGSTSIFGEQEPPSCSSLDMDAIDNETMGIETNSDPLKGLRKESLQQSFQTFKEFTDTHGAFELNDLSSASIPVEEDQWEPLPFDAGGDPHQSKESKSRRRSSMPNMTKSYSPTFSSFPKYLGQPQIAFGEATEKILNNPESRGIANENEMDGSLHVNDLQNAEHVQQRTKPRVRRVLHRASMPTMGSANFQFTAPTPAPHQNGTTMPSQCLSNQIPVLQQQQEQQPVTLQAQQQQQQIAPVPNNVRRIIRRSSMPTTIDFGMNDSNHNGKRGRTTDPSTWPAPFLGTSDPSTWPAPMVTVPMTGTTPGTGAVPQDQYIQPGLVPLKVGSNHSVHVADKVGMAVDPWEPIVATKNPNADGQIPQHNTITGHSEAKRRCSMPSMHVLEDTNVSGPVPSLMAQVNPQFGASLRFSSDGINVNQNHFPPNIVPSSSAIGNPSPGTSRPVVSDHPRLETDPLPSSQPRKGAGGGVRRSESQGPIDLPESFFPSDNDVICGRGKQYQNHSGNKKFRKIIDSNLERYDKAESKPQKSRVVIAIVDLIRDNCKPFGGFVDKNADTGRWFEIGDSQAREKVGHALRFHIASQKRKAKKAAEKAGQPPKPANLGNLQKAHSQNGTEKPISQEAGDDFASFVLDTFLQPVRDNS